MEFSSVNKLLEKSIRDNWDRPALSNYQGVTLFYRDVARRIAKLLLNNVVSIKGTKSLYAPEINQIGA